MTIEQLAEHVDDIVATAPNEKILLTKAGKPFAMISDASAYDEEDLAYINDPKFWEMIAKRRKEPTVSDETIRRRLEAAEARQASRLKKKRAGK